MVLNASYVCLHAFSLYRESLDPDPRRRTPHFQGGFYHRTSAFAAMTFLSDILRSLCFLGLVEGLTCNLCSIISMLTHVRSKVLHANTSLFLSKNESNYASSLDVKSWDIITVLSGTLGSSGTLLVSHSGSIGLLAKLPSFSFLVMLL
jgi:hypothetical protein